MAVTRTLGPLHFEDLDPKRFEDLVRQLVYDFKRWRRLEATGRAGSDDGFDARGYEITQDDSPDETDEQEPSTATTDRLWLIQCKRERTIPPAKLKAYLNDIRLASEERLHGIVFCAACDFSKRARDTFRMRCEELGIEEWHLWGKAELEDLLFQPRNDSLLFAYFGVSLTIRRRSQKTELRARLAMKRKANRILETHRYGKVLLRSPDSVDYPYTERISDFEKKPPWIIATYKELHHSGLLFTVRRHFAYLNDSRTAWDAAFVHNDSLPYDDPWRNNPDDGQLRQQIYSFWSELPKSNQAWFELNALVPFEAILDIDELGDEYVEGPHIYVPFNPLTGPYTDYLASVICADQYISGSYYPNSRDDGREAQFAEVLRADGPWGPYAGTPCGVAA